MRKHAAIYFTIPLGIILFAAACGTIEDKFNTERTSSAEEPLSTYCGLPFGVQCFPNSGYDPCFPPACQSWNAYCPEYPPSAWQKCQQLGTRCPCNSACYDAPTGCDPDTCAPNYPMKCIDALGEP